MTDEMIALDARAVDEAAEVASAGMWQRSIGNVEAGAVRQDDLVMNATMGVVELMIIHALAVGARPESVAEGVMRALGETGSRMTPTEEGDFLEEALRAFRLGLAEGRLNDAAEDVAGHA